MFVWIGNKVAFTTIFLSLQVGLWSCSNINRVHEDFEIENVHFKNFQYILNLFLPTCWPRKLFQVGVSENKINGTFRVNKMCLHWNEFTKLVSYWCFPPMTEMNFHHMFPCLCIVYTYTFFVKLSVILILRLKCIVLKKINSCKNKERWYQNLKSISTFFSRTFTRVTVIFELLYKAGIEWLQITHWYRETFALNLMLKIRASFFAVGHLTVGQLAVRENASID